MKWVSTHVLAGSLGRGARRGTCGDTYEQLELSRSDEKARNGARAAQSAVSHQMHDEAGAALEMSAVPQEQTRVS